jgi:hypothetical protein
MPRVSLTIGASPRTKLIADFGYGPTSVRRPRRAAWTRTCGAGSQTEFPSALAGARRRSNASTPSPSSLAVTVPSKEPRHSGLVASLCRSARRAGFGPSVRRFTGMAARKKRRWVATVKTASTYPPAGLFTKDAATIARSLSSRKVSPKGPGSGMRMLTYFINRAGRGLSQKRRTELERAKRLLSERIRQDRQRRKRKAD